MREEKGNIWYYHDGGNWVVITTNGDVKKNGEAVMGKGVALEARLRFPKLPREIAEKIKQCGNHVYFFPQYRIITFPTKHNWRDRSILALIIQSAIEINHYSRDYPTGTIFMVRPGVGEGQLDWETKVKPILKRYLDNRFVVVEYVKEQVRE